MSRTMRLWLAAATVPQRLAVLRILFGAYATLFLVLRFPHFWQAPDRPSRMWEPIGLLSPLDEPINPTVVRALLFGAITLGLLYITGMGFRWVGPGFAITFLAITTYRLSWGSVLHTEHLVAVHVLIVGLAPTAAWADSPRFLDRQTPSDRDAWALRITALVTVLGYLVSGISKLRLGGLDWLSGEALRNQVAFDNLRKTLLGDAASPLAAWSVRNGAMFSLLAPMTILVELLAPLALVWKRFAVVWITSAWLFHVGVLALMAILFPYQITAIAFAPLAVLVWPRPNFNSVVNVG